jgi:hypothetical protein
MSFLPSITILRAGARVDEGGPVSGSCGFITSNGARWHPARLGLVDEFMYAVMEDSVNP